jgi:putative ABC transport system ATP-binding protein
MLRYPLISVKNLSKSYPLEHGTVYALKEIDLEIYEGESVAIMGPSGSGKSTLLHLLGCLDTPTTGTYFLNDQDVSSLNDTELSPTCFSNRICLSIFQSDSPTQCF